MKLRKTLKIILISTFVSACLFIALLGSSIAVTRHKIHVLNGLNEYAYNEIQMRVNQHELQAEISKEQQYGLSYNITIDRYAGYE